MPESSSGDELFEDIADRLLRGQDLDVDALIAATPKLSAASRDKLRKLAGAFGAQGRGPLVMLATESRVPFEKLGPYTLISCMGEGGMGRVYLAEHGFLQRRVALKIIRPELAASPITRQRFQREAMRIARLRHENIVSVYDAGEVDGVAFLAMELVEGSGLDDLLRVSRRSGTRMKVVAAVRHARDIALALQCAHDAGIIHRDVKPSNVRITPDERALLLDFGLSFEEEAATLSGAGQFHGTPQYASPEQIESKSGAVDARTDIYSLGVTLYECLTGRPPFAGTSVVQLFHQILSGDVPEPRESNGEVDAELNGIVMRAISKRAADRFGSAREMAQVLDAWLGERVQVEDAATRELSRVDRRARPGVRTGVVTTICLVVLGSAAWYWFRTGDHGLKAAPQVAQAVVLPAPRINTPLFGAANTAFDQRLRDWGPIIGPGTFGPDEDGTGVIGTSAKGITVEQHGVPQASSPRGSGRVSGRFMPMATRPGELTAGCGIGVELGNGKIVAVLMDSAPDVRKLQALEIVSDGNSGWARGSEIQRTSVALANEAALTFSLSWNETDMQFDCGADTSAAAATVLFPRAWRGAGGPRRFFLVVDTGGARFEALVLEES